MFAIFVIVGKFGKFAKFTTFNVTREIARSERLQVVCATAPGGASLKVPIHHQYARLGEDAG